VKDRILLVRSIASTDPQRVPPGIQLMDRIIAITDEKFIWETAEGYRGNPAERHTSIKQKR
jgi:hypothetical protein